MDILERYLQAIGQYLPAETKDDTIAELRSNLMEQIDAREEELARPLTGAELGEVLRAHGKPEVVALRYLPQRSLIGPTVFPFYTLTLRRVLPIVVLWSAVANAILFVVARHESLAHALVGFALGLWPPLLISAAIITAIFATIEWARQRGKLRGWNEWDPAKLPAVKSRASLDSSPRSMAKRVIDLCVHCLWMAYLLWAPWHSFWLLGPGVYYLDSLHVGFASVWHVFYTLLIVLLAVQLGMKILAFAPGVSSWLKPFKLLTDLIGVVAVGIMALSRIYLVPADARTDLHQLALVNDGISLAFRIAVICAAVGLVAESWKYLKLRKPIKSLVF